MCVVYCSAVYVRAKGRSDAGYLSEDDFEYVRARFVLLTLC